MSKIENISIGFFGTSIFALKSLSKLYENQFNIKFVVSQAPKPSGRGKRISDSPVGDFAKKKKLSLLCPDKLDEDFYNQIASYNIDFIVVVAYGKLLTSKILRLPKFFYLDIPDEILIRRLLLRGRKDDIEETIKTRLKIYKETTEPLIEYYEKRSLLVRIDADRDLKAISNEISIKMA